MIPIIYRIKSKLIPLIQDDENLATGEIVEMNFLNESKWKFGQQVVGNCKCS
jgi:hypothetical protein